jgi:hypothetical protein
MLALSVPGPLELLLIGGIIFGLTAFILALLRRT